MGTNGEKYDYRSEMKQDYIKECPFCGAIPEFREAFFGMERIKMEGLVCQNCSICAAWEDSKEAAIKKWNTRVEACG